MTQTPPSPELQERIVAVSDEPEAPAGPVLPTRREETLLRVRRGLLEGDAACLVQVIELIRAITVQADQISVHEMAEILGRDPTTMNHLLRTACSVGYNPDGIEITSLPQAVQLVGYDRIRNIAVSLLLLQNADRPWSEPDFEQTATTMLVGALLAEALADTRPKADPGVCFLATALRGHGRILLALFLPDQYREARRQTVKMGEAAAFQEAFGIDPDRLGRLLLDQAGLPDSLLRNLDPFPADLPEGRPISSAEESHRIVDFAAGVSGLFAAAASRDEFEEKFAGRMARIGRALNCPRDSLVKILESVLRRMDGYRRSLHSPAFSNRVVLAIRAFVAAEPFPSRQSARRSPAATIDASGPTSGGRAEDSLRPGLAELNHLLAAKPLDRAAGWSLAIRLLWRDLELESCFVLLRRDTGEFTAAHGFGPGLETLRQSARLTSDDRSVFSVSRLRGREILLQRPHEPSISTIVPEWLKPVATGAILILPVSDHAGTFALLVCLAPARHAFALSPKAMDHLHLLRRSLAALAMPEPR